MIDLQDMGYEPSVDEIGSYIRNDLFSDFSLEMETRYKAKGKAEFSKCSWEHGWNLKFKKSGKSLCTIYPREGYFTVMVVIGQKEKEEAERILPQCSSEIRQIYMQTKEGNGQRWLMIDLEDADAVYEDVLALIDIRCRNR